MLFANADVPLWSTHCICLSVLVWLPEIVPSKVHVAPPLVDLYDCTFKTVWAELMPMVLDQAVPSEVHSTVGSEWKASPLASGRFVCPHVRSEEHTSELQSRGLISYAVFCL